MRRIKSTNTTPERIFGKLLWAQGIHYRKHSKELPGKPDFSISKYKIAIFIDGEFWHGFDWDTRKSRLKSNRDYWIPKIERNIERDREINSLLEEAGWNVVRYWGVEIEKQSEACVNGIIELIKRVKNAG
jgi:DNA mismatch endonuclease (patch repair protein)